LLGNGGKFDFDKVRFVSTIWTAYHALFGLGCKDTLYSQLDFGCTYILSTKGNTPSRKKIFTQLQRDHALELLRMYREHVRKECTLKPDYDDDINRI